MKKQRKTFLGIFTACVFAILMMFNVNSTEDGYDFSLCGETVLADGKPCNEEEPIYYYNNSNVWDARNCNLSGDGCLTCTVPGND